MNTKILVALVIAFAVVGLTGAASAQDGGPGSSYTGYISYDSFQIIDTEEPTEIDIDSGACFRIDIDHFDTNYGVNQNYKYDDDIGADPGGVVPVGAGVCNMMVAGPDWRYSEGVEHQVATQGGSAGITINTKDTNDEPEVVAAVASDQSLWYSGSFSGYYMLTDSEGMAGAYGLLSDGLDFGEEGVDDDCGNVILKSATVGYGETLAWNGAKITEGTFSVSGYEGMVGQLEGVALGEANFNVYGGCAAASTFEGAVGDGGVIETYVDAWDVVTVETGFEADNLDDLDCCPAVPYWDNFG